MKVRRIKPSVKKPAPETPPADTPEQALLNVEALLKVRNAGWDRIVVRDIIKVVYGSTEEFAKKHLAHLRHQAGKSNII